MSSDSSTIIMEIARAIAASPYPYSGAAMVCLPDKQITRQELWDSLSETERNTFLNYAYAAYNTIGGIGMQRVMMSSFENYLAEK